MSVLFHDRAPLEKVRRLADGRLAAVAKFARSGCYTYSGAEVGRPDLPTVTVYRPEEEVFSADAMASFAHKTITLGHPNGSVNADNWKEHSVGWTEGRVARDGEFVEIPLILADAKAVAAYDAGTKQLSAGYESTLDWGEVVTPSGEKAQATMRGIRGDHIALVAAGRAGERCSIGDAAMNTQDPIEAARRVWAADKATRYRNDREAGGNSTEERTFTDARGGIADARAARLHRLSNAYRG